MIIASPSPIGQRSERLLRYRSGQFGPDRYAIDYPPEGRVKSERSGSRAGCDSLHAAVQPACRSAAGWLKARSIVLKTWLGENGFAIKPSGRAALARCRIPRSTGPNVKIAGTASLLRNKQASSAPSGGPFN